jgi:hypothetical protein
LTTGSHDDPAIIAGQGTMGLEILEDMKNVDMRATDNKQITPIVARGSSPAIRSARRDHARKRTFRCSAFAGNNLLLPDLWPEWSCVLTLHLPSIE